MRFSGVLGRLAVVLLARSAAALPAEAATDATDDASTAVASAIIKPKVFIISMFGLEASVWYGIKDFNVQARNIIVPGLSPRYPQAHCTASGDICQVTTGEAEINAATSIQALTLNPGFDLTQTYFLVAGIAGVNPKRGSLGSVGFARFAVSVALQYEFDIRELGDNFTTGYIPYGTQAPAPAAYPPTIYGTEAFEVNDALRKLAMTFASKAKLSDSADAAAYRAKYNYTAAKKAPSVIPCDVSTSDVYFSGKILGDAFENFTSLITNNTAAYCTTAQEDTATLEAMVRAAKFKKVDYSRVIIMRTAAAYDRPPPGETAFQHLFYTDTAGFEPSLNNIYLAGVQVVKGITANWDAKYKNGIKATNYVGDIFGTLGGVPDFGPYPNFGEA